MNEQRKIQADTKIIGDLKEQLAEQKEKRNRFENKENKSATRPLLQLFR
jgi:hypothetical protein